MTEEEERAKVDRIKKVIVYTIGSLDELIDIGLVTGGQHTLSEEGKKMLKELDESDFKPTDDEVRTAIAFLQKNEGDNHG